MAILIALSSCGGGSTSSGPVVISGILIAGPAVAVRGSIIELIPQAQTSSTNSISQALPAALALTQRSPAAAGTSTTLIPPDIRLSVEQGTLLDINGKELQSITVPAGTPVSWQLPDSVGTFVARASYAEFNASVAVLTTDALGGGQP